MEKAFVDCASGKGVSGIVLVESPWIRSTVIGVVASHYCSLNSLNGANLYTFCTKSTFTRTITGITVSVFRRAKKMVDDWLCLDPGTCYYYSNNCSGK